MFLSFILIIPLFWAVSASSQTNIPVYKCAIGDTILLFSGRVDKSDFCFDVLYFGIGYTDTINFFVSSEKIDGGFNYQIFFAPKKASLFCLLYTSDAADE